MAIFCSIFFNVFKWISYLSLSPSSYPLFSCTDKILIYHMSYNLTNLFASINRPLFCFFGRLSERSGIIHDGFGNYTADVKCSWLIESSPNTKIRMHVEQFATECGWDHLYIYDGDSVEAPLLAVFSGLMHKDGYHIRRVPEVIARSGSVLLHFYSDVAYNMSGFNITYKINACPSR